MYWLLVLAYIFTSLCCAQAQAKSAGVIEPETLELTRTLATKPELMNIEYLQYVIGLPEQGPPSGGATEKTAYWYGPHRQLNYELHQQESYPGQVVSSDFLFHFPDSQVSFSRLEKEFGSPTRRLFDQQCHPAVLYSFAPNTSLTFYAHKGAFGVKKTSVSYRGPVLSKPSPEDIKLAEDKMTEKMLQAADKKRWKEVMPLAMVRLRNYPDDAQAHYLLGRSLASSGHINQAIVQYKLALAAIPAVNPVPVAGIQQAPARTWASLATASASDDLRQECLNGLKDLKALDLSPEEQDALAHHRRNVRLVQDGQRLRAGTQKKVDPDQAAASMALPVSNQGNR